MQLKAKQEHREFEMRERDNCRGVLLEIMLLLVRDVNGRSFGSNEIYDNVFGRPDRYLHVPFLSGCTKDRPTARRGGVLKENDAIAWQVIRTILGRPFISLEEPRGCYFSKGNETRIAH